MLFDDGDQIQVEDLSSLQEGGGRQDGASAGAVCGVIKEMQMTHHVYTHGPDVPSDHMRAAAFLVRTHAMDGLHGELAAALLCAAVEGRDVLLLSKRVGLRKHGLYLTNVALLKAPVRRRRSGQALASAA